MVESVCTGGLARNHIQNTSVLDQHSLHPQVACGHVFNLATAFSELDAFGSTCVDLQGGLWSQGQFCGQLSCTA